MLIDHIPDGAIRVPLGAAAGDAPSKDALVTELVDLLPHSRDTDARDRILKAVLHRERQMSTGIGDGIAVPHGVADIDDDLVVSVGIAPEPGFEFQSIDKLPARVFFLLVARPTARALHMQTLATIARMMQNVDTRASVLAATDANSLRDALAQAR